MLTSESESSDKNFYNTHCRATSLGRSFIKRILFMQEYIARRQEIEYFHLWESVLCFHSIPTQNPLKKWCWGDAMVW